MKTTISTEKITLKPTSKEPDRPAFKKPGLSYTLTSRDIVPWLGVLEYIKMLFPFINPAQVTSLFGFTSEFSPLYGGRQFNPKHTLAKHHLAEMETLGIHLSLNLTNHYFNESSYQKTLSLLEKHHRPKNSITCFNDKLAERLRQDFPDYTIKASIIKNLNSREKVEEAFALYDEIVIPMDKNDDTEFLAGLPQKERIILFADASCAYNCPRRSCYLGFSQKMQSLEVTSECSKAKSARENLGKVFFDLQGFYDLGYRQMKLIPPFSEGKKRSLITNFQDHKTWHILQKAKQDKQLMRVASYPKSGRTWLRYFLACYMTRLKKLDIDVDLVSMFTLFPNDNEDHEKGRMALNTRFHSDIPLIQFSHALYSDDQAEIRTLLLLRSIPDTLVSEYFHFNRHLKSVDIPIADYLFQGKQQGVNRLCRYLNSWALQPQGSHSMTISYEALHKEPDLTFTKILGFFNIEVDKVLLKETIERSSFKKMAELEALQPIAGHHYNYKEVEARRVRKGQVNSYQAYLNPDTSQKIHQICDKKLSNEAKLRLTEQGLWIDYQINPRSFTDTSRPR